MRKGRAMIWSAALAASSWAGSTSAGVTIRTHRPDITFNYWIARNEDLRRLMARPGANLRNVLELFGKRPINSLPLSTKPNVGYTVFPECRGRPKQPGVLADGGQREAWVDC